MKYFQIPKRDQDQNQDQNQTPNDEHVEIQPEDQDQPDPDLIIDYDAGCRHVLLEIAKQQGDSIFIIEAESQNKYESPTTEVVRSFTNLDLAEQYLFTYCRNPYFRYTIETYPCHLSENDFSFDHRYYQPGGNWVSDFSLNENIQMELI